MAASRSIPGRPRPRPMRSVSHGGVASSDFNIFRPASTVRHRVCPWITWRAVTTNGRGAAT
jgi:hypothetical protein